MDGKDLIETLTTIGIFAISVAIGLISEHRKKRGKTAKAPRTPKPQAGVRRSVAMRMPYAPAPEEWPVQQPVLKAAHKTGPQTKTTAYSFTAAEEGVCALDRQTHPQAHEPLSDNEPQISEADRRETLRTLIVGEILASPRFKN